MTEQEPVVVVPAHPGAGDQLVFEARREQGGLVLPVFSSVGVLVAALGQSQPWAAVPLASVMDAAAAAQVGGHGDKLGAAAKKYQDAEQSSTQLVQDLTRLITGS